MVNPQLNPLTVANPDKFRWVALKQGFDLVDGSLAWLRKFVLSAEVLGVSSSMCKDPTPARTMFLATCTRQRSVHCCLEESPKGHWENLKPQGRSNSSNQYSSAPEKYQLFVRKTEDQPSSCSISLTDQTMSELLLHVSFLRLKSASIYIQPCSDS